MAQVLPAAPQPSPQPQPQQQGKVVPLDACRKSKESTPEAVAILSLFLG